MGRTAVTAVMAIAAAGVVAGGCGSSSEKDRADGGAAPPAPAKTQAPAAATGAGMAAIKDFTFTPERVAVAAGDTVTWTNEDAANHNVTFDDKSVEGIDNLREGKSGKVSFAKPGTYAYVCTYHPGMKGTVVVK